MDTNNVWELKYKHGDMVRIVGTDLQGRVTSTSAGILGKFYYVDIDDGTEAGPSYFAEDELKPLTPTTEAEAAKPKHKPSDDIPLPDNCDELRRFARNWIDTAANAICPRCHGDEWIDDNGIFGQGPTQRVPCPVCQNSAAADLDTLRAENAALQSENEKLRDAVERLMKDLNADAAAMNKHIERMKRVKNMMRGLSEREKELRAQLVAVTRERDAARAAAALWKRAAKKQWEALGNWQQWFIDFSEKI